MRYSIKGNLLIFNLKRGEKAYAKPGTTVLSLGVDVDVYLTSIDSAIIRKITGENLLFNVFTSKKEKSKLILSNSACSEIVKIGVKERDEITIGNSYLSHIGDLNIKASPYISNLLFLYSVEGKGTLFLSSPGKILKEKINGELLIKSSSFVAFKGKIRSAKRTLLGESRKAKLVSSRDFFIKLEGNGTLYLNGAEEKSH